MLLRCDLDGFDPRFDGLHFIHSLCASMLTGKACVIVWQLHWMAAAWEAVTASAHSLPPGLTLPYSSPAV